MAIYRTLCMFLVTMQGQVVQIDPFNNFIKDWSWILPLEFQDEWENEVQGISIQSIKDSGIVLICLVNGFVKQIS